MHAEKTDVLRRLASIQGHLQGIRKMVESDTYCVDILKQTHAVKRAIDKLEGVLVAEHLTGCVISGIQDGRQDDIIQELNDIFELSRK
jgi:DNA-binding FrmR family transcriptional regulator